MGLLDKVLVGGAVLLVGAGVRAKVRDVQETKRRRACVPQFDARLSADGFARLAADVASRTARVVRASVDGLTVTLVVRSNSGLTEWTAQADFNDYGRLTGTYWLTSQNDQSPIPRVFAKRLQDEILERVEAPLER